MATHDLQKKTLSPSITIQHILKYTHELWDWSVITERHDFDMQLLLDFPTMPWNWVHLFKTRGKQFVWDFIFEHAEPRWSWYMILEEETACDHIDRLVKRMPPGDFFACCMDIRGFASHWASDYPQANWNWKRLSHKQLLDIDFIVENPDRPYDWLAVAYHKDLTWKVIDCIGGRLPLDYALYKFEKGDEAVCGLARGP